MKLKIVNFSKSLQYRVYHKNNSVDQIWYFQQYILYCMYILWSDVQTLLGSFYSVYYFIFIVFLFVILWRKNLNIWWSIQTSCIYLEFAHSAESQKLVILYDRQEKEKQLTNIEYQYRECFAIACARTTQHNYSENKKNCAWLPWTGTISRYICIVAWHYLLWCNRTIWIMFVGRKLVSFVRR